MMLRLLPRSWVSVPTSALLHFTYSFLGIPPLKAISLDYFRFKNLHNLFFGYVHVNNFPKLLSNHVPHTVVVDQQRGNQETARSVLSVANFVRSALHESFLREGEHQFQVGFLAGVDSCNVKRYDQTRINWLREDDVMQLPRHGVRQYHPLDPLIAGIIDCLREVLFVQLQADGFHFNNLAKLPSSRTARSRVFP